MQSYQAEIDVIIPVYNGKQETLECLHSVFDSLPVNKVRAEVIVVYDAGPDDTLREEILQLASQGRITLLINDSNIGFVRSVNRGMEHNPRRDVVLLNSDTRVHGNWLDRLARTAAGGKVGTVTPFSNNAEICSWPVSCSDNPLPEGYSLAQIDDAFASLGSHSVDIPTAVGFCMYIRRSCLDQVGMFNAALFGRGYGEENDFCMRAQRAGFRHVLACDTFVFHQGGVSFAAEKNERVKRAMATLDKLYPDYHAMVARFIEEDPTTKWRYAAELMLRRNQGIPLVLHVSHGIGGGTDKHVVELAAHTREIAQHGMLVPQANSVRLVFPNVLSGGLFEFGHDQLPALAAFMRQLNLIRVHVHHVKGWEGSITPLLRLLGVPYDVTVHDYYFIHANPALADVSGVFCDDRRIRDQVCEAASEFPAGFNAQSWRREWGPLLRRAVRIFAPTQAARDLLKEYYPSLEIMPVFHPDWHEKAPYPPVHRPALRSGEKLRVLVLGAVSVIKGADVLEKVALQAEKQNLDIEFILAGYAYRGLASCIETTGPYADRDLPDIVSAHYPHLIWFPCTWPETYSYTLSFALEQGIPVLCPNLGAFPERVIGRPYTWLEDWRSSTEQRLERLLEIKGEFSAQSQLAEWSQQPQSIFDYRQEYMLVSHVEPQGASIDWETYMEYRLEAIPPMPVLNRRFFGLLLWLNCHPIWGRFANAIPLKLRRSIKRRFSRRPLHD